MNFGFGHGFRSFGIFAFSRSATLYRPDQSFAGWGDIDAVNESPTCRLTCLSNWLRLQI